MLLMKKPSLLIVLLVLLSGCAKSGIVQVDPDTFMISRQADIDISNIGTLRADAIQAAYNYCISQNKFMRIVDITEYFPPDISRGFPRAEVQFMCLEETDERFTRPKLQKTPDIIIKIE